MECPAIPYNYIVHVYNSISPILYFDWIAWTYTYVLLIKIRYYLIIICSISLNCVISETGICICRILHDNSVTLQRSIFVKLSYFLKKKNRNINLFLYNVETKKMIQFAKLNIQKYIIISSVHWNFIVLASNFPFRYLLEWSGNRKRDYLRTIRARDLVLVRVHNSLERMTEHSRKIR